MDIIDIRTVTRMCVCGDRFGEALASLCFAASDDQLAAIKHALPEVFEKYRPPGIATPGPVEARVNP